MTASLNVSVVLSTNEPDVVAGVQVIGDIYPAHERGTAHRNVIVPCGPEVDGARYDVEPGRYVVSATLPSGAVLTEDVEVGEGEDAQVRLDATDSPYETHAWQYLMGNIESGSRYRGRVPSPRPPTRGSLQVDPTLRVTWVGDSQPSKWSFDAVSAMASGDVDRRYADWIADTNTPPQAVSWPDQSDGTSHLYRFGPDGPVNEPGGRRGARQFVVVEVAGLAHLVTLPAPWEGEQIEVLVNGVTSPTGSAVSVAVRDPAVGAGLAYMARGAFDAAARLFTDVEDMLYAKVSNPLAAAAGGYVLVGSNIADDRRPWDSWLDNLRAWFGWMSDGSILWAVRHLRLARTPEDVGLARDALIEAYDRGVPVYTLGLTWLLDGLSEFPDDEECAVRLERARRLSWAVDLREPFLVVKLPGQAPP